MVWKVSLKTVHYFPLYGCIFFAGYMEWCCAFRGQFGLECKFPKDLFWFFKSHFGWGFGDLGFICFQFGFSLFLVKVGGLRVYSFLVGWVFWQILAVLFA